MKLNIRHPNVRGFAVPVEDRDIVVGREGGPADLELNWDARVSRRHARIWRESGCFWFEDLGSRNGTWLGQRRLSGEYPLIEGVTIKVGECELTLIAEDEPAAESLDTGDLMPHPLGRSLEVALAAASPADTVEIVVLPPELDDFISAADLVRDLISPIDDPFGPNLTPTPAPVAALPFTPPPVPPPPMLTPRPQSAPAPSDPPPPAAPEPPPTVALADVVTPTFVGDDRVLLSVPTRVAFASLWSLSISKGALFVPTERPSSLGRRLHVLIDAPDGAIELAAEVVHVVEPRLATRGMPAGVGLQLTLAGPTRAAIERYVDGRAAGLSLADGGVSPPRDGQALPKADVARGLARVRELIGRFEENDIYGGLEVAPTTSTPEIVRRFDELRALFGELQHMASPPQLARIASAGKLLDRAEAIMTDADRRLDHDFRHGVVRADERVEDARQGRGPSIAALREAWNRALPERHDKALVLMREVVAAKKRHDVVKAVRLARAALELDPFHEELRRAVEVWEKKPSRSGYRAE